MNKINFWASRQPLTSSQYGQLGYEEKEEELLTMKLWKRVSALVKDKNSIYLARLSRKTSFRHPQLEECVIKATSHEENNIDYRNAQRIFTWIRTSPRFLKPVIWAMSTRMQKTRYWVVALKGLMLMHGIFCCNVPGVQRIGRLPFDLSNFSDGYSDSTRVWGLCMFIRAYFAVLDQKSVMGALEEENRIKEKKEGSIGDALEELQTAQLLLDMLLQVKPYSDCRSEVLVLEAMDCIVIEIFDVYSKICSGVAGVLMRIYGANQVEAKKTLRVLHKATSQSKDLNAYFEFCRNIGVLNASEFPRVEKIPEEDIRDLERIVKEISNNSRVDHIKNESLKIVTPKRDSMNLLKTIITDNWVVFDDEFKGETRRGFINIADTSPCTTEDPFAASVNIPPLICDSSNNFTANSNDLLRMQQYCSGYGSMQGALSCYGNQGNLLLSV